MHWSLVLATQSCRQLRMMPDTGMLFRAVPMKNPNSIFARHPLNIINYRLKQSQQVRGSNREDPS
jgi:hypothetical protein